MIMLDIAVSALTAPHKNCLHVLAGPLDCFLTVNVGASQELGQGRHLDRRDRPCWPHPLAA